MTRAAVSMALSCGTLVVGLYTARYANENHDRGEELDRLQRECEELEAIRARRAARARAHVPGEADPPAGSVQEAARVLPREAGT